jgi:hypothetical protein
MKVAVKLLSLMAGAALLAATAHVTVTYIGGYGDPYAALVMTVAVGVGISSIVLGHAWSEGRPVLCGWLIFTMLAGELFGFSQTGNRIVGALDAKQAPAQLALAKRHKAEARLDAAQAVLSGLSTTSPEIEAALRDKADKDRAVLAKSDTKSCAANCRALLEQQVADAATAVGAARERLASAAVKANREVIDARSALDAMPANISGAPFADRIGMPPWLFDVISAVLGSIGANGLAAGLLAFGSHRAPSSVRLSPAAEIVTPPARAQRAKRRDRLALAPPNDPRQHAAQFGVSCFRPDPEGELPIIRLHGRYREWCEENGHRQLAPDAIASELRSLFDKAGLPIEERGKDVVVRGLALAE